MYRRLPTAALLILLLALAVLPTVCYAKREVVTHADCVGNETAPLSPYFKATVAGIETMVYFGRTNESYFPDHLNPIYQHRSMSWLEFGQDMNETATVEIALLADGLEFAQVPTLLPLGYGISVAFGSLGQRSAKFNVSGNFKHMSLEFTLQVNTSGGAKGSEVFTSFKNSMMIFVGDLDPRPIPPDAAYFGPGVHNIVPGTARNGVLNYNGSTVYIARGAWVYGKINFTATDDSSSSRRDGPPAAAANVLGFGVIDGSGFNHLNRKSNPIDGAPVIGLSGSGSRKRRLVIHGVTSHNPSFRAFNELPHHSRVVGFRQLAWYTNNGAVPMSPFSELRDSFIRTNDDSVHLPGGGPSLTERVVVWQGYNGSPIQLGWRGKGCVNCTVRGINVIHAEWPGGLFPAPHNLTGENDVGMPHPRDPPLNAYQKNCAVINLNQIQDTANGNPLYRNVTIEDVKVDTSVGRILGLVVHPPRKDESVTVNGVLIKDLHVHAPLAFLDPAHKPTQFVSVTSHRPAVSRIHNIVFENLRICGRHILSSNETSVDWLVEFARVGNGHVGSIEYK